MEESEHDIESLEQLELHADEYYLTGEFPLEDTLGKIPHRVEKCHQRNVGPLTFHVPQLVWTGYHKICPSPKPLRLLCGQYVVRLRGWN